MLASYVFASACGGGSGATPPDARSIDAARAIDGPAGSGTVVNGTLGGMTYDARDAVWTTATASGFDFNAMSTFVEITDFPSDCSLQMTRTGTPNGRLLYFALAMTDGSGNSAPASAPGTYTVITGSPAPSSMLVEAYFEVDDASCLKSSATMASSGTVIVTSATDPFQATFDLMIGSEHVTGTIHAASCAALDPNSTPLGGC